MRVVVTGGRDFIGRAFLNAKLDGVHRKHVIDWLGQGGMTGADTLAADWARRNGVSLSTFSADWTRYGKPAGPIRNTQMLKEGAPDVVVAFKGGDGTQDCIDKARTMGIRVWETWK